MREDGFDLRPTVHRFLINGAPFSDRRCTVGSTSSDSRLKVDLKSGINLYTVVFSLHGAVLSPLIIAEGLVQQVVCFGIEGVVFRKSVTGVYVQIVPANR